MVREEDGLRPLEVRVAREIDLTGVGCAAHEHLLQLVHAHGDVAPFAAQVEAQVECDLVVAAAARVELGARRARQVGDAPLDGGVDVLVGRRERERSLGELLVDGVEGNRHGARFLLREEADAGEHGHVHA